jgi:hypothetical protein
LEKWSFACDRPLDLPGLVEADHASITRTEERSVLRLQHRVSKLAVVFCEATLVPCVVAI